MKKKLTGATVGLAVWCAILAVLFLLASCGSMKKTERSVVKVKSTTQTNVDSSKTVDTETKVFGDTLTGTGFIPANDLQKTDSAILATPFIAGSDTSVFAINTESKGIKLRITSKPVKDNKGHVIGNEIDYSAIAKPTATTDTHEVQHTNVRTTKRVDSTQTVHSRTTTKTGFSLPPWVYWAAGLILLLLFIIYIAPIIQTIKNLLKIL